MTWSNVRNLVSSNSTSGSSNASDIIALTDETNKNIIYEIPLAVLILATYIVLGHGLELWKEHQQAAAASRPHSQPASLGSQPKPMLCTFHESGAAILLGLAVGLLMNYGGASNTFDFDANVFFYVVLPPIIFHQGYAFKKRNFFKYFHYIFGFGIIGTLIQFIVISLLCYYLSNMEWVDIFDDNGVMVGFSVKESMTMASVFCAADEIATLSLIKQSEFPKLSAILFGEGVMNDAMSILLFHAVTSTGASSSDITTFGTIPLLFQILYLCITAGGVGMGSGLLVSLLLKSLPSLQTNSVRQTAILMLGGYFSFSVSEALELSGVLTVFFCGLTLSHYAWHSLGTEAQVASKITSDTISMIAEAYCFAAIGLSVHEFNANQWCFGFIVGMLGILIISRLVAIFGICLAGYLVFPKTFKMPLAEQNVLFFGGLVRGAISWAQVMQVSEDHRGVMVTTTLGVVLITVIIFGAIMPFFTKHLSPESEEEKKYANLSSHEPLNGHATSKVLEIDGPDLGLDNEEDGKTDDELIAQIVGEDHMSRVHDAWAWFDDNFMKPFFGGSTLRHSSIIGSMAQSNSSKRTMRVRGNGGPRVRTYSGITRIGPQSYGATQLTDN